VTVAAAVVFIADPLAFRAQVGAIATVPQLAALPVGTTDAPGGPSALPQANLPQAAPDAVPAPQTTSPDAVSTPQLPPLLRVWDHGAAGIVSDPVLVSRLDQALAGVDGHVGVAVKDLGSGRGAVLDGDLELQSASLYKLPVLYTVFDVGLNMYEELPITPEALSYDSGTMELGVGETLSVAEALERMVTLSDNTSAIMLGSRVGANRIDASIAALGMDTTHYSLERMTTSALDMLHLVEFVADGDAVSRTASADMLHLMLRQRVNDRLPRLLPYEVQVAHKTGNLPGVVNDVGVLYGPTSTIAIAALVSDTSDETAASNAIAQVALVAYTYFADQPEEPGRPLIPPAPSRPIPPIWREPQPIVVATPTDEPTQLPVEPTPLSVAALVAATAVPTPTIGPTAVATSLPVAVVQTAVSTLKPTPLPPPTATPVPATATAVSAPPTQVAVQATKPPARAATPTSVKAR
jgi:beta-lactamase class A